MRDFKHTIKVLSDAWNNNRLIAGSCTACAVGNIVVDACEDITQPYWLGYRAWYRDGTQYLPRWIEAFGTNYGEKQNINYMLYTCNSEVKYEIDSTGYSFYELAYIENQFETGSHKSTCLGIHRVVEALGKIHNMSAIEVEDAKMLFTRSYQQTILPF